MKSEVPSDGGTPLPSPKRHHRVRTAVLLLLGVLLALVAVAVVSYLLRSKPGALSLRAAGRSFHATTTTMPTPKDFALPPAGVYRASGSGFEQLAVPPETIHDSAVMPVTVSYLPHGCWRWHIDYNTAHWHEYDFCPHDGQLLLTAQRNSTTVNLGLTSITNLAQFTCSPPSPIAVERPRTGEHFTFHCTGTNTAAAGVSTASGPVTLVGVTSVRVGGKEVPAIELTRHQKITGGQSGTLDETWWFAASTGMPLREIRDYRLSSSSPIGPVAYTERGSWRLDSMTPTISGTTTPIAAATSGS